MSAARPASARPPAASGGSRAPTPPTPNRSRPLRLAHLIPAAALLLGACVPEPPQTLHCGEALVTEGDLGIDLARRCGEPTRIEQAQGRPFATPVYDTTKNRYVIQYIPQPYEVWTYAFGPGRTARISVKEGVITKIAEDTQGH